jgi:hypothetical protein
MASTRSMSGDPLEGTSLAGFAGDLRAGKRSREAITSAYLDLIARLDGILGSYQHVAGLRSVRTVDNLLAASTDLGPLMGMPVAVRSFSRLTACQPPSVHSLTTKNCLKRRGFGPRWTWFSFTDAISAEMESVAD